MNLTRVLNNALPEIPARILSQKPPRLSPDIVFKEQIEDGQPVIRAFVKGKDALFKFPPQNWALIQLFDGQRSFKEIAELYSTLTGHEYGEEEVHNFADSLEAMNFWYKTPQETNILLMQMSADERRKLVKSRKSRFGDLSEIAFPAFNPDRFVTWLYRHTSFIYTWWFTLLSVLALGVTIGISITHWNEIWRDTVEFFNFSKMSAGDLAIYFILSVITLCWHELAHAHACKHYGGRVSSMGFLLIYLMPAFFTDTSEGYVTATRYQRLIIDMAGAYSELLICAVATPVWWATQPGTILHDSAYLLMLMSGIVGLLLNWNPLMKLDGYYMLCEITGIPDLKEDSTAYVAAWVKRNIWGLPVEVPYVPQSRRLGFAVYALLSGAYSYSVLYIMARFVGNVVRNFSPEWGFIPELAVAALIFRSRIRLLVNFMKFVYLDKKERILAWFTPQHTAGVVVLGLVVLALPLWHESVLGRFALEPVERAVVRNIVPGTVARVYVDEGMAVRPGDSLIQLNNLPLQSRAANLEAEYALASLRSRDASLHYVGLGHALQEREQLAQQSKELESQIAGLKIASPISGIVLTSSLRDRLGSFISGGTQLVEIANLDQMRARVYISEHEMDAIHTDSPVRLNVDGFLRIWDARTLSITPVPAEVNTAVTGEAKYKGLTILHFYQVDLLIPNPRGILKPGMVGTAKIYGERRSLAGLMWKEAVRFLARKAW
jgi:putative peptide zinc metalloprotease protein